MAETKKFPLIRGRAMRITKLDTCGNPVPGARNQVTSKGFITVSLAGNVDEGTTVDVTNAAGEKCVHDEPEPQFQNYTVEVAFCDVDPDATSITTGNQLVLDADDNRVGFDVGTDVDMSQVRFALEVWSLVPNDDCEGGAKQYGYFLLPFIGGGQFGDFTIGNDAVTFTVSGAKTKNGASWGAGPYDVQLDSSGDPGPMVEAIGSKKHLRVISTEVPPPTNYGTGPVGSEATGATAGIPATLTPANTYPPDDLADAATGFVASPLTAWTAGQYVTLGDGSKAHWTSSAWAAGPA